MEGAKLFDDDTLYTVPELAERLRMTRDALYRYVRTGKLKAYRVAGKGTIRILGKDINEFLSTDYFKNEPTKGTFNLQTR